MVIDDFHLVGASVGKAETESPDPALRSEGIECPRTAWSKGLRERVVIIRHTIKNALIPVVTLIGLQLPILVGGSVAQYLLGTDHLGRDFLSPIFYGARISLTVGLAATALNVVVAVLIGGVSGFFGGKVDLVVQRFVDTWMSFPGLLLLLTVMSILGKGLLIGGVSGFFGGKVDLVVQRFVDTWMSFPGLLLLLTVMSILGKGLIQIIVLLGILGGIGSSRVVRGAVIAVKENVYFQAAEAIGSSQWRIYIRHVLPNIVAPVIIGERQQPVAAPCRGFRAHTAAGHKPRPVVPILLEPLLRHGLPGPGWLTGNGRHPSFQYDG